MSGAEHDGSLAPGFHSLEVVHRGAASTVYRALRDGSGAPAALKVMRDAGGDVEIERLRELARLPGVVRVLGRGRTSSGRAFVAMDYCEGGDYATDLRRRHPLPVEEVVRAGRSAAAALHAVHERGLLYHGVEPANLLRSARGAVLADAGEVRPAADRPPPPGPDASAIVHAPPEAVRGEPATPASDVYRLASTLWTLLAGHPPFADGPEAAVDPFAYRDSILTGTPPRLPRSDLPGALRPVLARALAQTPGERYATAADFAAALDAAFPLSEEPGEPGDSAEPRGPKSGAASAAGNAGAAGAAVGLTATGAAADRGPAAAAAGRPQPAESAGRLTPGDAAADRAATGSASAAESDRQDPDRRSPGASRSEPPGTAGGGGSASTPEAPSVPSAGFAPRSETRGTERDTGAPGRDDGAGAEAEPSTGNPTSTRAQRVEAPGTAGGGGRSASGRGAVEGEAASSGPEASNGTPSDAAAAEALADAAAGDGDRAGRRGQGDGEPVGDSASTGAGRERAAGEPVQPPTGEEPAQWMHAVQGATNVLRGAGPDGVSGQSGGNSGDGNASASGERPEDAWAGLAGWTGTHGPHGGAVGGPDGATVADTEADQSGDAPTAWDGGRAQHATAADHAPTFAPAPPPAPPAPSAPEAPAADPAPPVRRRPLYIAVAVVAIGAVVVAVGAVAILRPGLGGDLMEQAGAGEQEPTSAQSGSPGGGSGPPAPPASTVQAAAPTDVALDDSGDAVVVSWTDNSGGEAAHYVVGGPVGTTPANLADADPGTTKAEVSGLNATQEYCFTVVAVLSVDEIARSAEICTDRGTG